MIFTTKNETIKQKYERYQKIYAQFPNPIPVYVNLGPCPNCEEWCANDPKYTCNYSCSLLEDYTNGWVESRLDTYDIREIDQLIENRVTWKLNENISVNWSAFAIYLHNYYHTEENLKEVCPALEKKNFTCKFYNNYYPVCTNDFKPYEQGMEKLCGIAKEFKKKEQNPDFIYFEEWEKFNIRLERLTDLDIWTIPNYYQKDLAKHFGMQCTNGKLYRNYSIPIPTFPTPKTTKLTTKTSTITTTTKMTTKTSTIKNKLTTFSPTFHKQNQPIPVILPSSIPTKLNHTEAISQVITGVIGINFLVVGGAIIAVLADLV